jgi:WD40 repeat protein/tRNA A-37 threonylcarbamoyl transferase component Bud32
MSSETRDAPTQEKRLHKVIADYLAALQAGQSPDRQAFLARYPELAAELTAFFAEQDQVHQTAPPLRPRTPAGKAVTDANAPTLVAKAAAVSDAPLHLERYFGDYELVQELARGGMGVVYKARQITLHRTVALKMILAGQLASLADVQRFRTEAEAAANLEHSNIVPIYEVGEYQGQHYFSMRLVDGGTLAQQLPRFLHDHRAAGRLLATVARAVHYAHQRGVLHRDLKPANILLDADGQPHVTDFGLAKQVEDSSGLTGSGVALGTPSYMAPEQAAGRKGAATTAADVYGLGAILYEMLTGQPPFKGETALDTLLQVREREPPRPRALNPRVDRDLETICLKCLAKEPGGRYSSADAVADDLERWLACEPIRARRSTLWERSVKWARRRPAVAGLTAVVAVLVLAGVVGAMVAAVWFRRAAEDAEDARRKAVQSHDAEAGARRAADRSARYEQAERRRAEALAENNRLHLYAARIHLAHQAWQRGDAGRVQELLDSLWPKAKQPDLRGFEWYYLWRLCHTERVRLTGHVGPVRAVAFAPDGKTVATAGDDKVVRLWKTPTARERRSLRGHTGWVTSVAFAPDGKTLATAGMDQTVRLWDPATGKERLTFRLADPISCLAFNQNGSVLAAASARPATGTGNPLTRFLATYKPGEVKLWDTATGKERQTLRGHGAGVLSVAFAPDSKTLATASADRTVKLWDTTTGIVRRTMSRGNIPLLCVAFAPGGKSLATGSWDRKVILWDPATGKEQARLAEHRGPVFAVAFDQSGRTLASASTDQTVKLWDLPTRRERLTIKGHTGYVWSVVFAPDDQTLATGSWDGTARIWDAHRPQDYQCLKPRVPGTGAYSVAFTPDGKMLASGRWRVHLWNTVTAQEVRTFGGYQDADICVASTPDGKTLATGDYDGFVKVWDLPAGTCRFTKKQANRVWSLAFSPNGKTLAWAGKGGIVSFCDVASGRQRATINAHTSSIRFLAYAPDGRILGTVCHLRGDRSLLKLWDVATGKLHAAYLRGHTRMIEWITFAPDGKTFATGSWDRTAKLWDTASGKVRATLTGHMDVVYHGTFSPDGKTLATAGWDGTVRLWHVATGQELASLRGSTGLMVWSVAFSRDGRSLAMGSGFTQAGKVSGEVTLWRAAAKKEVARPNQRPGVPAVEHVALEGHSGSVWCVAVSPLAPLLASGGEDATVRLWDMATGEVRRVLRGHTDPVRALAFSPDGKTLATVSGNWRQPDHAGEVKLWEMPSGKLCRTLRRHQGPIYSVAFSPGGLRLATGESRGCVRLWDPATGKQERVLQVHAGSVSSLVFTPDKRLVTGSADGTVKIWQLDTGQKRILRGHRDEIDAVAITANGKLLATGSRDGTARLWDLTTFKERGILRGHEGWVSAVRFAPDETMVVTGSSDTTLKVWDVRTAKECATLRGSQGGIASIAFAPDGRTLVSAGHDGLVLLWYLPARQMAFAQTGIEQP